MVKSLRFGVLKMLLVFLSIAVLSLSVFSQNALENRAIHCDEFNWSIEIPEGYQNVDASEWDRMKQKGEDAIEETFEGEIVDQAHTIFVFRLDDFNYFEANWQPFDPEVDGDYTTMFNEVNSVVYETFKAQIPDAELKAHTGKETINGLEFHVYNLDIIIPGAITIRWSMYCRVFDNKEFTVNMMTIDKENEKALMKVWKASTFK